jgi:hypothetical protein
MVGVIEYNQLWEMPSCGSSKDYCISKTGLALWLIHQCISQCGHRLLTSHTTDVRESLITQSEVCNFQVIALIPMHLTWSGTWVAHLTSPHSNDAESTGLSTDSIVVRRPICKTLQHAVCRLQSKRPGGVGCRYENHWFCCSRDNTVSSYPILQGYPYPLVTLNPFGRQLLLSDVSKRIKWSTWIERSIMNINITISMTMRVI